MASIYDLYIDSGSEYAQTVDLFGDWTNHTISISIVDSIGIERTASVSWIDEQAGTFLISMTNIQTASFANGVAKYIVEVSSQFGEKTRVIEGRLHINGGL